MTKPRLVFFISHLRCGGAEIVLTSILSHISDIYDVYIITDVKSSSFIDSPQLSSPRISYLHKPYTSFVGLFHPREICSLYLLGRTLHRIKPSFFVPLFLNNLYLCFLVRIFSPSTRVALWEHTVVSKHYKHPFVYSLFLYLVDAIFFPSLISSNDFSSLFPRIIPKVKVLSNPCQLLPNLDPPADYSLSPGSPPVNLVCIGRLSREKQPHRSLYLLRYLASHSSLDYSLSFYGDGSLRDRLVDLSISLNLDKRVTFNSSTLNLWKLIPRNSVILILSEYESFSMVALEALCLGYYVLISSSADPGIYDSPLVVSIASDSIPDIASALLSLNRMDSPQSLGHFNHTLFHKYSPSIIASNFVDALSHL